ncbi:DUF1593 domain-containing protein [Streptomyces sp. HPF1205]|uniref:DUF1593 domain-containing protein n=1 Tax=Streptomyces sp. HPF1205 TaxID=2873262 RepID=UPI001CEC65A9|nr:DUF1593 domain-containing protein [Streptomyces sp. HPF1205]
MPRPEEPRPADGTPAARRSRRAWAVLPVALTALAAVLSVDPAYAGTAQHDDCGPSTGAAATALADLTHAAVPRPRVIVTTDGEIDDKASFHRFLLYSDEFDVQGLIYTSSRFHWAGNGSTIPSHGHWGGTTWMTDMINGGYAQVYRNLAAQDPRYPTPARLSGVVRVGNIENVGDMAADTPGSDLIKQKLLDDRPGPLWLDTWGGTNTIARALKSIQDEYSGTAAWPEIYRKVSRKAFVYVILDQDTTYKDYIATNWPDIRLIMNNDQFQPMAYKWKSRVPAPLQTYFQGPWMTGNIVQGPLAQDYPVGPIHAGGSDFGPGEFISEGDSPSFMNEIPTGLRSAEDPTYGGWGGRFAQVGPHLWTDLPAYLGQSGDQVRDLDPYTGADDRAYPQARWTDAFQNDFAARVAWTTAPDHAHANHAPVAYVPPGRLDIDVRPGQTVHLNGIAADPDGDACTSTWWQYREAGTYPGAVPVTDSATPHPSFTVPDGARPGQTIHLVFQVTDKGTPPLTGYQRVIATVR